MPCTPDAFCDRTDTSTYAQPNFVPAVDQHFANMGWVGFLKLRIPSLNANNILRVTTADINLSQEITMPDVIDGRIDKTVYQLGPKIVEGTVSMPVIADVDPDPFNGCPVVTDLNDPDSIAGTLLNNVWCWATARGPQGRLLYNDASLEIRYANHAAFTFDTAVVNTLSMTVAQSDAVNFDINIFGRGRAASPDPHGAGQSPTPVIERFLSPARILTWNDVTINGVGGCSNPEDLFFSNQVREFNMEINNNADRFYTLCGSLFPVDVNVGKREISGSLTLLGMQHRLRQLAESNQSRFTEKNEIRIAFYVGDDRYNGVNFTPRDWTSASGDSVPSDAIFGKRLAGVVFQIEEMSMTNDLFETTVNWLALANDQEGFEAIAPGTSCSYPLWQ